MMPTVYLCSLPADSTLLQASWLNKCAELLAPNPPPTRRAFVHSELFFPTNNNTYSSSVTGNAARIVFGGTVELTSKSFNRSTWQFDAISVSTKQHQDMLTWLRKKEGAPFDYLGYAAGCTSTDKFYCSRLAGMCLRDTNVVPDLTEKDISHPERLATALHQLGVVYTDTPRSLRHIQV